MDYCNSGIKCDSNYEPMCGTDGMTYVNRCRMMKARCHHKFVLYFLSQTTFINLLE